MTEIRWDCWVEGGSVSTILLAPNHSLPSQQHCDKLLSRRGHLEDWSDREKSERMGFIKLSSGVTKESVTE